MKKNLVISLLLAVTLMTGCGAKAEVTSEPTTEVIAIESTESEIAEESTEVAEEPVTELVEESTEVAEEPVTELVEEPTEVAEEPVEEPYSFAEVNQTMYAQSKVNVRDLPEKTGNKLGGLTKNQEVTVTGKCNETGWYRISWDGGEAYVSDSYLGSEKVVVQAKAKSENKSTSTQETTGAQQATGGDFQCGECGARFATWEEESQHLVDAHGYAATVEDAVNASLECQTDLPYWPCMFCDATFATQEECHQHEASVHGVVW